MAGVPLKVAAWQAGCQIQVQFGGFTQRTFTPVRWNEEAGETEIIIYVHGHAPAAEWIERLEEGSRCIIFGPRASLDLLGMRSPVLFGDETTFGLASLFNAMASGDDATMIFEVSAVAPAREALKHLGLQNAILVQRRHDDSHLALVEDMIGSSLDSTAAAEFVLTGRAPAIQHIVRFLKSRGLGRRAIRSRAFWTPGKSGLD